MEKAEHIYKIELLIGELEKSAKVLEQRGAEYEQYKQNNASLTSKIEALQKENEKLEQMHFTLVEQLSVKVVDLEQAKSKLIRLEGITLKNYEDKLTKLVAEIEKLNSIIHSKVKDQQSNKISIYQKIQDIEEERRRAVQVENFIGQMKSEKLEVQTLVAKKEVEINQLKQKIEDLKPFQGEVKKIKDEIEIIRKNYTDLFEEHLVILEDLRNQLDTQKQINANNVTIFEDKFQKSLSQEKENYQFELKEKVSTAIVQLENRVSILNNLIDAKSFEMDKIKMDKNNVEMEDFNTILIEKNIQIQDLHKRISQSENLLIEKVAWLDQLSLQIQTNQLVPAVTASLIEQQVKQIEERIHSQNIHISKIQEQNLELQKELQQKTNSKIEFESAINTLIVEVTMNREEIDSLAQQFLDFRQLEKKSQVLEQRLQEQKFKFKKNLIFRLNRVANEEKMNRILKQKEEELKHADEKIKYLLELMEKKEKQLNQINQQPIPVVHPPNKIIVGVSPQKNNRESANKLSSFILDNRQSQSVVNRVPSFQEQYVYEA